MAFWNRRRDTTGVPQEVQEYYQTAKRERAGVAWLLAIATLVVTVILALAIFFAGRWLWRALTDKDASTTETSQTEQHDTDRSSGSDTQSNGTGSTRPEQPRGDAEGESHNNDSDSVPTTLPGDEAETGESTNHQPTTTPRTGDAMPETGPGNIVAVFAAVTVAGYLLHRTYQYQKSKN